jgi:hypothetical protein
MHYEDITRFETTFPQRYTNVVNEMLWKPLRSEVQKVTGKTLEELVSEKTSNDTKIAGIIPKLSSKQWLWAGAGIAILFGATYYFKRK